ncbi:MAG: pseudaminic acid biosynthesis-associated methylase [Agathobacter sp.]
MKYKTEQESFWNGEFGNEYVDRNRSGEGVASNVALFGEILSKTAKVHSVIEFGSNIGQNLKAIRTLLPDCECSAIEINHKAAEILREDPFFEHKVKVYETSILDFEAKENYDFVLSKGVLIHINPDKLEYVYQKLYDATNRYICIAEYYNPTPVTVDYRGNEDRLFKRDFAGEFMDKFSDCCLIDYGFKYHRDNNFRQDDMTWFLLEKRKMIK